MRACVGPPARPQWDEVALALAHGGGQKGTGVLAKLRKLGPVTELKSKPIKGVKFPLIVVSEACCTVPGSRRTRLTSWSRASGRTSSLPAG